MYFFIIFILGLRHSLPSPVMESSNNSANTAPNTTNISSQSLQVSENTTSGKNINHEMKTRENAPSMKSQSRKGKTKETSPQSVSTSSKAKRSSSKKKKNSGTSSTGCSVLDQVLFAMHARALGQMPFCLCPKVR